MAATAPTYPAEPPTHKAGAPVLAPLPLPAFDDLDGSAVRRPPDAARRGRSAVPVRGYLRDSVARRDPRPPKRHVLPRLGRFRHFVNVQVTGLRSRRATESLRPAPVPTTNSTTRASLPAARGRRDRERRSTSDPMLCDRPAGPPPMPPACPSCPVWPATTGLRAGPSATRCASPCPAPRAPTSGRHAMKPPATVTCRCRPWACACG